MQVLLSNLRLPGVAIVLILLSSCGERQKLRGMLRAFESSTIESPVSMTVLEHGQMRDSSFAKPCFRFFIYVPPTDCSLCRVTHLSEDLPIFELAEQYSFDVCVLFSPEPEDVRTILDELKVLSFNCPVWLDSQGEFYELNKTVIPDDPRFHYFLVNPDNHPVLVGNPILNPQIKSLLEDTTNERRE